MFRIKYLSDLTVQGVLLIASWLLIGLSSGVIAAQEEKPYGLAKREPWENTRFVGTPEPPLPYSVEPVFTNQSWCAITKILTIIITMVKLANLVKTSPYGLFIKLPIISITPPDNSDIATKLARYGDKSKYSIR